MIGNDEEQEFGLQIAPILDLLFVLLLFFMVSVGGRVKENELGVTLSAGHPSFNPVKQLPVITLRIDTVGQIYWNDIPIDSPRSRQLEALRTRLREKTVLYGDLQPVIVVPDRTTRQERLIDVLNAASAANVHNLALGAATK